MKNRLICGLAIALVAGATLTSAATTFTPLVKGFSWTPSTTAAGGGALPAGEVQSGVTIGIRVDGDTAHGIGNYQWLVVVPPTQNSESPGAIAASIGSPLPPGNYWAALDQTDILNGSPSTSLWTPEIPFSVPMATPVKTGPPTNFSVN